ncbi:lipopolysaccharide biosynthesis protein [Rhizobium sp. L1K21]|uniref:lipopolysaccharide biosynthesis protein n=1 Tax=Rhizobium sp. L1K21 TaxID=2954933 RepID=UPI00209356C1|nr:oligosaccharide flippase family protein [Rhizobium sp. L1K21]MCO6184849.1 oligosaccharide flippase family protein [Rhizobium sp. L1K21]
MAKGGGIGKLAGKSFLLRVTAAGMTYVFVVIMARIMDVKDFGVVGTIMSGSLFFSVVGCVGQRMALLRFVPLELEKNPGQPPTALIANAFRLALIGNFLVYLILVLAVVIGQQMGKVENASLIAFGLLIVPLTGIIDMQAHLARSYKSLFLAIMPKDILWRLFSLMLVVPVFFVLGEAIPLWVALVALFAVLVILIVGQGIVMQKYLGVPSFIGSMISGREALSDPAWKKSRVPFLVSSVAAQSLTSMDAALVGLFLGPHAAAIYFSANRLALMASFFAQSMNVVFAPEVSGNFHTGKKEEVRATTARATAVVFWPTVVVVAVLFLGGKTILSLLGPAYSEGYQTLSLLVLSSLVNAAVGAPEVILNMCGFEKYTMRVGVVTTTLAVILIYVFSLMYGIEGIAAAVLITTILRKIIMYYLCYVNLGFRTDIYSSMEIILKDRRKGRRIK